MKRLLLAGLGMLLAAGTMVLWFSRSKLPPEPTCQGKTLSFWLRDLDYSHRPADQIASNAVARIGTNALPHLGPMLRAHDSKLKLEVIALLRKQSLCKVTFTPAKELQERASSACRVLHGNAAQYVPELTRMLDSPDSRTAWCGLVALMDVQPRSEWPSILDKGLTNASAQVRYFAASQLGSLGAASSNSVPKLLVCLTDSNANVRGHASNALSRIVGLDVAKYATSEDERARKAAALFLKHHQQ